MEPCVLIRNDDGAGSQVLEAVGRGRLAALDCMRDAKLVCADGAVRWSALLLSQWSDVVSKILSQIGGFTSDHPLVIMLPDAKVSIVEKILNWSTRGMLKMTSAEIGEATAVLCSLGIAPSFSQTVLWSDNHGRSREAPKRSSQDLEPLERIKRPKLDDKISKTQTNVSTADSSSSSKCSTPTSISKAKVCDGDNSVQSPDKGVVQPVKGFEHATHQDSPQSTVAKGKASWDCPLCPLKTNVADRLIRHLCSVHYCKDLLTFWGQKQPEAPCLFCNQNLFKGSARHQLSHIKVGKISVHLGITHGKILSVVSDEIREVVLRTKPTLMFDVVDPTWLDCLAKVRSMNPTCKICCSHLSDPQNLKNHLAQVHFSQDLLKFFLNSVHTTCNLCEKRVEQKNYEGQSHVCIKHLLNTHVEKFYQMLPSDLLQPLKTCLLSTWQLEQACRDNSKAVVHKSNVSGSSAKNLFPCPLCDSPFDKSYKLKAHLCATHFRQELLSLADIDDIRLCPLCGVTRGSDKTDRSSLEGGLACHIGKVHGGLTAVLPAAVKARLAEMRVPVESKANCAVLERSLQFMDGDDEVRFRPESNSFGHDTTALSADDDDAEFVDPTEYLQEDAED